MDPTADVRARYARFAADEAPGRSDVYAEWAAGVAGDESLARILATLPSPHRQPPVVFAVTRMLGSGTVGYVDWSRFVRANADRIVAECAARTTQTNEPLRCAPIAFALARIPGPIALLEIGASAGLCLFPDRYAYRFVRDDGSVSELAPNGASARVVLESALRGGLGAPTALPEIVWRRGVDLQPRDASDPADRAWISGLVWPGETARARRIDAALDLVASERPEIVAADAAEPGVLEALVADAPRDATLVIATPGVLPHIPREKRERLTDRILASGARWITLDSPRLHAGWSLPDSWPGFALAVDGEVVAAADPLGGWIGPGRVSAAAQRGGPTLEP